MELLNRFYQLDSHVRHYAWGVRRHGDSVPYIADLLGEAPGNNIPWAELWIGAHPSLPSDVKLPGGGTERLDTLISHTGSSVVGAVPEGISNRSLPFLLKVLSCERALSIQSHPDKVRAERLHRLYPSNYPDDNHKPEVLIALGDFEALAGFRPLDEALADLSQLESIGPWRSIWEEAREVTMRVLCETLLNLPGSVARVMLVNVHKELEAKGEQLNEVGRLCLKLQDLNPCDRGIMFAYLLNHVHFSAGDSMFIPANIPHAYICGTGIECMANSDNVIRAGLTPKFIDIRTLLSSLDFSGKSTVQSAGVMKEDGERVYETPAKEFQVSILAGAKSLEMSKRRGVASVFLVLDGEFEFDDGQGNVQIAGRGTTWFRPATLMTGTVRAMNESCRLVIAEAGE